MAIPKNGLTNTMCLVTQKLSDSFLKRINSSTPQVATISGSARRSKSAVPGWYKRMSMGSNDVSSGRQYAGMSPSSRFVTSSKIGSLVKSSVKNNDIVPKEYLMNQLNGVSIIHSDVPKMAPRARSLPRWKDVNTLSDREWSQENSTDMISRRACSGSTQIYKKTPENLEDTLSTMEGRHNSEESIEDMESILMSGAERKDDATAFKRRVNINLNDLDPVTAEDKKTLSMDINVVVSVKSPENGLKPEIGFQEHPGKLAENKTRRYMQSAESVTNEMNPIETAIAENLKITDKEEAENIKFGSEQGLLSQKDITEEIGKVYNFLKNNDGTKSKSMDNNSRNSNTFLNYDAVKKLYVNALGCVKACEELKSNTAEQRHQPDIEYSTIINELEDCLLAEGNMANSGRFSENLTNFKGLERKHFLAGTTSDVLGMRMYSSKSGCEKAKQLPCLQSSELSGVKDTGVSGKSVCEKMCMPCCKPARDPPRCFYPYHKVPCKKLKAPRPAFSECKQLFEMKQISPCECIGERETKCKKKEETVTCAKR